jgi:hypothetical protein
MHSRETATHGTDPAQATHAAPVPTRVTSLV